MEFELIRSPRRRRVAFRFDEKGKLIVMAPELLPVAEIQHLVELNGTRIRNWRQKTLLRPAAPLRNFAEGELFPLFDRSFPLRQSSRLLLFDNAFIVVRGTPDQLKAQMELLYRRLAQQILTEKCLRFGAEFQLTPASVGITGAATRWGSCSGRKHISFCWKLMLIPEKLADYVVCHELAHLREMNHSARFWAVVSTMMPEWQKRRAELKQLPELW